MTQPLVLFGGTFDPVHFGHLLTARAVAESLGLERITLMPTAVPPHKREANASSEDRLAMLRLAIHNDPLFDLCMLEIDRPGPSYTIDTVEALIADRSDCEVSLVVGADMLEGLGRWHRSGELLKKVKLIVACRPNTEDVDRLEGILARELGGAATGVSAVAVSTPMIEISSTDIRRRVGRGLPIRYLTTDEVVAYIADSGLYTAADRA